MRTACLVPLFALAACARAAFPGDPPPPEDIVRVRLPSEGEERQAISVPSEPENTVEVDFPWPVDDWAGRGFTPDAEKFAGDFVIEATRGKPRIFVTPVAADAHRVLHVVLAPPGAPSRSVPLEFLPAPVGLAWRKVVIEDGAPAAKPRPRVTLTTHAPSSRLRDPSPEAEIGLIRTLRLMLNTTEDGAHDIADSNSALELACFSSAPRSFGDFTIQLRFALADTTTGALGLCASVANHTARRLVFDPGTWVARVGDRAYPVPTVDFPNELEPGATGAAFMVIPRGPDGEPTGLRPDNAFELSVLPVASLNPRPVLLMPVDGLDRR